MCLPTGWHVLLPTRDQARPAGDARRGDAAVKGRRRPAPGVSMKSACFLIVTKGEGSRPGRSTASASDIEVSARCSARCSARGFGARPASGLFSPSTPGAGAGASTPVSLSSSSSTWARGQVRGSLTGLAGGRGVMTAGKEGEGCVRSQLIHGEGSRAAESAF